MKNWIANETTEDVHKIRRWQLIACLEAIIIIIESAILLLLK